MEKRKPITKSAFTLIELLVVVAIIGILAAVGVVAYNGYTKVAKIKATTANHKALASSISAKWQLCNTQSEIEYSINGNKTTLACGTNAYQHLINASMEINAKNPWDTIQTAFSANNDNFKPSKGQTNLSCVARFTGSDKTCRLTTNTGEDDTKNFHIQTDITME